MSRKHPRTLAELLQFLNDQSDQGYRAAKKAKDSDDALVALTQGAILADVADKLDVILATQEEPPR